MSSTICERRQDEGGVRWCRMDGSGSRRNTQGQERQMQCKTDISWLESYFSPHEE